MRRATKNLIAALALSLAPLNGEELLWQNKDGKTITAKIAGAKLSGPKSRWSVSLKVGGKTYRYLVSDLSLSKQTRDAILAAWDQQQRIDSSPGLRAAISKLEEAELDTSSAEALKASFADKRNRMPSSDRKNLIVAIVQWLNGSGEIAPAWRDELLSDYLMGSVWRTGSGEGYTFRRSTRGLSRKRHVGDKDGDWRVHDGAVIIGAARLKLSDDLKTITGSRKGTMRLSSAGL